ncbi:MAG: 3'-5' exonuclease domain-containing protein 2 [Bacteroidales bacterium]|nr:3'-5' exonuclease domain-containing protein 2 [Bacteroidales bacterium]
MYKPKISEEELKELEPLQFEGPIHLITSDDQIADAIAILNKSECIGFDTETKPTFTKNTKNSVSLLQLSTEKEAFLFRLHYLSDFEPIFSLLSDPKILKVGVAVDGDLRDLLQLKKFRATNFVELQSYVKNFKIENISLKKLGAIVLNGKISKRQQRSNWELNTLSEAQLRYAATDAWASLMIYKKLKSSFN